MDVSGSMNEHMKDLAKRFFMLLYLFLQRRYEAVDVVFIRHTDEAKEVDEDTFFTSRKPAEPWYRARWNGQTGSSPSATRSTVGTFISPRPPTATICHPTAPAYLPR